MVLRDAAAGIQVFMVRRHTGTAFMPGADVFPGGRVDEGDREAPGDGWCDGAAVAAVHLDGVPESDAVAYHVAAVRELFEEAGILLARGRRGEFVRLDEPGLQVRFRRYRGDLHSGSRSLREVLEAEGLRAALDALVPFAHWLTPPMDVRRFDTRFFVARMPSDQTPAHDDTETTHGAWVTPADALDRCRRGETSLPVPTWTTLRELEAFATVDQAIASARRRRIHPCEPQLVERGERRWLVLPGDPLSSEPPHEPHLRIETRFELVEGRWLARSATGSTTKD